MPRSDQSRAPRGPASGTRRPGAHAAGRGASGVNPQPLQRQTVASMTLDALRDGILHGNYREGEPLRQDALADQLGVSRIPIREALRQLEAEGLVAFSPHRGAIVTSLSLAEIEEVFEVRAVLEPDLLRRALPRLTPRELAAVDELLDRYEAALRSGDVSQWGELNWQFHSSLYAPAGRPVTMGILQRLHQHSDRYLRMQLALTHGESRANEEHRAIARAVRAGDAKRASTLLRDHITGASRSLLAFLRERRTQEPVGAHGRNARGPRSRARRNGGHA